MRSFALKEPFEQGSLEEGSWLEYWEFSIRFALLSMEIDASGSRYPLGDPPFLSSIESPPSLSFLRCATSQLYTRAKATSSVCNVLVYIDARSGVQLWSPFVR